MSSPEPDAAGALVEYLKLILRGCDFYRRLVLQFNELLVNLILLDAYIQGAQERREQENRLYGHVHYLPKFECAEAIHCAA